MGKSKDKKVKRETKEDKYLTLGVKRKQLKRKKDRGLDRAVGGDATAKLGANEDKELARRKKMQLMKQQKKNKHAKLKSNNVMADSGMELLSNGKDDSTPKLKKKTKKKAMGRRSPVKANGSSFVSADTETPKLKKKKTKVKEVKGTADKIAPEEIMHENQDEEMERADVNQLASQSEDMDIGDSEKAKRGKKIKSKKVKKSGKANKTNKHVVSKEVNKENHVEASSANLDGAEDVDEIPSVDEDCSRGMKKWILEYKQKRPGLKILQERIDEFIVAHEEQQEKERKEREERAAEEGWTVVVHHKGRKKSTDAETGTAVGSVSLAAMQEKMANKKPKEVAQNFYRFQKREAHLSELAMLKSRFEQDKKRIQQLRAQRKFKPY